MNEKVYITGIGLLSTLGEGAAQNFNALLANEKNVNSTTYAPYNVCALPEIAWEQQIPKRDIRQMGQWQIVGTYAAGLALEDANIAPDNEKLRNKIDMIIAARGSACDIDVNKQVLELIKDKSYQEAQPIITQYLCDNLRPTLFLTQLPNLLAGNISIVHKITGSSRTFMGEEGAGIAALQTAFRRIQNKQSEITLVGGAFVGECLETILSMELGKRLYIGDHMPILERLAQKKHGMMLGSAGAFLVLESQAHATARGATPYCLLEDILSDSCRRENLHNNFSNMLDKIDKYDAVLCGTSGIADISETEMQIFENNIVRNFGTKIGHSFEAHFPFGVALAALALKNEKFYSPFENSEKQIDKTPEKILTTTIGASQAEGLALLTKT